MITVANRSFIKGANYLVPLSFFLSQLGLYHAITAVPALKQIAFFPHSDALYILLLS